MSFFSIIIPTYNSDKTLKKTLDSIIKQSFQDFEVLIADGDSKDSTVEIAKSYKDNRFKIFSEKDQGVYDAMNKGISKVTGDWLYFLGSDDELYDENILSKIYIELQEKKIKVLYGNVVMVGDTSWAKDKTIYDGEFDLAKIIKKNISHQAIFYHKTVFKKLGLYNINYNVNADWDFNLRVYANFEFRFIDTIIAKFSGGGISTVQKDKQFFKDKTIKIIEYFYFKLYRKEFKPFEKNILQYSKVNIKKGNFLKGVYLLVVTAYLKIRP